jgi:hypothetical protein
MNNLNRVIFGCTVISYSFLAIYSITSSFYKIRYGFALSDAQKKLFTRKHIVYVLGFIVLRIWYLFGGILILFNIDKYQAELIYWKKTALKVIIFK